MITLTAAATSRVRDWIRSEMAQGKAFRIYVEPGNATGYDVVYQLDKPHDDDRRFPGDGFQVVIDPWSYTLLRAAVVDASSSGFSIRVPPAAWGRPGAKPT
jgi:Fe-S cluster assembly iron-binding protein IscA